MTFTREEVERWLSGPDAPIARALLKAMDKLEAMEAIVEASCACKASGACGGYCKKRAILNKFKEL